MKYLIIRTEYISENSSRVFNQAIETDNIETTRKELHQAVKCLKILFVYRETEQSTLKTTGHVQ